MSIWYWFIIYIISCNLMLLILMRIWKTKKLKAKNTVGYKYTGNIINWKNEVSFFNQSFKDFMFVEMFMIIPITNLFMIYIIAIGNTTEFYLKKYIDRGYLKREEKK